MILLFPLALALLLVAYALGVAVGTAGAFLCGSLMMLKDTPCWLACIGFVLFPVTMALGGIAGFFVCLYFGFIMAVMAIKLYCKIVIFMLNGEQVRRREPVEVAPVHEA
jgi:hypothetical protein